MAVIASLTFHVPQSDELEKRVKKIEKGPSFKKKRVSKKDNF
jgi:hypothetical protein